MPTGHLGETHRRARSGRGSLNFCASAIAVRVLFGFVNRSTTKGKRLRRRLMNGQSVAPARGEQQILPVHPKPFVAAISSPGQLGQISVQGTDSL